MRNKFNSNYSKMVCKYPDTRTQSYQCIYIHCSSSACVPPPIQSGLVHVWGVVCAPLHSAAQGGTTLLLQQTVGVDRLCWETSLWSKTSDTQAEDKKGQPSACDGRQHMVVEGPPSTVTKVPSGRFDSGFVQKDYYWEQTVNAVREAWWGNAEGSRTEAGEYWRWPQSWLHGTAGRRSTRWCGAAPSGPSVPHWFSPAP